MFTQKQRFAQATIRVIFLVAFLFSMVFQAGAPLAQAGYNPEFGWLYDFPFESTLVSPAYFDLELDSNGYPHLAYFRDLDGTNNDGLIYSYFDGTAWQTTKVNSQWGLNYVSLELDADDHPHISYYLTVSQMVEYTYFDGSQWNGKLVTPTQQSAGQFATLALTEGDVPVVAFYYPGQFSLAITKLVNGSFETPVLVETAAVSTNTFSYISMQMDAADHPHLAYCIGTLVGDCNDLHYASYDGSVWSVETVDEAQGTLGAGYYASLALDSSDMGHISYHVENNALQYALETSDGWDRQQLLTGNVGQYSTLALDGSDQPHIAFYNAGTEKMNFAFWDGAAWDLTSMNPDAYKLGMYLNLELDAVGNPTLAFWDSYNLRYGLAEYQPLPDLAVTQFFVDEADGNLLATIRNDGESVYNGELEVELYINNTWNSFIGDAPTIQPGEIFTTYLPEPACPGGQPTMQVKVCLVPYVQELNGDNNCLTETWVCAEEPLAISAFAISGITTSGFTATWTTNRPANSVLTFSAASGRAGGTYTDDALTTTHSVTISGLSPHQVYYVSGFSTDAAGVTAKSTRKSIKTLAYEGVAIPEPVITSARMNTREDAFQLNAAYTDTSNIQMVNFFLDGTLIGTDYSPEGGQYSIPLYPARRGFSSTDFYRAEPHQVVAQAVNYLGNNYQANPELFAPLRDNLPLESELLTPAIESTIHVPGTTVPAGMTQQISVFARQFEWECDYSGAGMPDCGDVAQPVSMVRFFVDGVLKESDSTPDGEIYSYTWDMSGKPLGLYNIKAVVLATDGTTREHTATIRVDQAQPDLAITRSVSRYPGETYFRVRLTVSNDEAALGSVDITSIRENFKGFQPVNLTTLDPLFGNWTVTASTALQGKQGTATITLEDPWTLDPGEVMEFNYYIVPIMFPDMSTAVYKIGSPQSKLFYDQAGMPKTKTFSQPNPSVWDGGATLVAESVANAMQESDYLLITAPSALTDLYNLNEVHQLMGDMARLSMLKGGILAYWDPNLSKDVLNQLLQDNSDWTNRLHPNFETRFNGYVLLVGESEIIPGYTTGPYELYWTGTDGGENYYVNYSDNPYAHTDGNGAPDLLLGRIIGNSAFKLDQAILNSIDTHIHNSYQRDQAYVASGVGNGESGMQSDANTITNTLVADGYSVSKHHWEQEAFLYNMEGVQFTSHDGLAHGDVDGDGSEEVIWADRTNNKVYFIKPAEGLMTFAFNLVFDEGDGFTSGDVDNNGQVEIIIADRDDTIRSYNLAGAYIGGFDRNFALGEQIAAGDVLSSHDGDEIVMAEINGNSDNDDFLRIYTYTGSLLKSFNLDTLGYDFLDYDLLQVGNIDWNNTAGPDEIVFTDRNNNKIVAITADWAVVREINVTFDEGDHMILANTTGDARDEIVMADRDDQIRAYTFTSADNSVQSVYVDFDVWDGLVVLDVQGSAIDYVLQADRDDRMRIVDMNYPANAVQQFKDNVAGVDLIWFQAHGWAGGMDPAINVSNFPVSFSGSHPIVNAWSCTTGNYEGNNDNSIAEAFLQSGAGIYVGSTEVSPMSTNSNTSRKYYRDYWEPGENAVESLARFKKDRWEVSQYYDWWWYLINEYNVYGDPKFDIMGDVGLLNQSAPVAPQPQSTLTITLPDYTVETADGVDTVQILADDLLGTHDGDLFQEQGQYQVPIYVETIEIPAGQQVQNVILTDPTDITTRWGLNLPVVDMVPMSFTGALPNRSAASQQAVSTIPGNDWSPYFEDLFKWSVYDNIEGGQTLTLVLYPFHYDPAARYSLYFHDFAFNIQTIESHIEIAQAVSSPAVVHPGDTVTLDLEVINHDSEELDAVISTRIHKIGSNESVDGFDLYALDNLLDIAHVTLAWDWLDPNLPMGNYVIEVTIEDMQGQRLAQREVDMILGATDGLVTSFTAAPQIFQPGDAVQAVLEFANTGDQPITGLMVIEVQTVEGVIIATFTQDLIDLTADHSQTFTANWDSTGSTPADYRLVGYVQYASQITVPQVRLVTSDPQRVYLPITLR